MLNTGGREFVFVLSADGTELTAVTRKAQGDLQKTADTTAALDEAQKRAGGSADSLLGSLAKVGVGAFSLKKVADMALAGADALVQAQINADRLNLQLTAGAGAARAGQELDYVREVSNRLGLELNTTAASYARFLASARGTSLEGQGVRQVFDSVAKSAAVMGLNVDETQGVLRALEQMMSKGTVQAEELRGQLGDRMPGALQIAARALGVTTGKLSEMVEKGQVIASEFLPAFARQLESELGAGAEKAADKMGAAVNRVVNSWELLKQTVAEAGAGEFIKGQLEIAADGLNNVSEAMKRAKDSGGGFISQLASGTGAVLQFLNPFNAIAYSANSVSGELKQAKEQVEALKKELVTNPGNIFLRPAIAELEELIVKLERARTLTAAPAYVNLFEGEAAKFAKNQEDRARRMDALGKVTADLTQKNEKLIKSLQVLADSYQAGELAESDYRRMVQQAYDQFLPKSAAGPKKKPDPAVDFNVLDANDARVKAARLAFEADAKVRDFMLDQVQKSDERQMQARERQLEQSGQFAQQLVTGAESIYAQMLPNAEARGQALLAIEKAQLQARLSTLKLEGTERQLLQDEIDRYIIAAEAKLTDELRPEWQRRLEAWEDTNQLMRDSHAAMMEGIVNEGEQAFTEWLETGKLSAKSLVRFIGNEFAKLTYRQFLAPTVAQAGGSFLDLIFGSGLSIDANGMGMGSGSGLSGLPTRGGAATGSNYIERDMLTILHKGEAVIPRAFNPYGQGAPAMPRASAPPVMNITYNVPPGQSPASYAAALEANNRQVEARFAADLSRPGRPLQRAASRAARF